MIWFIHYQKKTMEWMGGWNDEFNDEHMNEWTKWRMNEWIDD